MTDLEFFYEKVGADETNRYTIGQFIRAVLAIDNPADALRFYRGEIEHHAKDEELCKKYSPPDAAKSNIGWCYGEGMITEHVQMWCDVCGASHPVFGKQIPDYAEAMNEGIAMGQKLRTGTG